MNLRLSGATLALACVCVLQLLGMLLAPPRHLPQVVTLRLAPGESLTLGRAELAAPRAAARQFTVRRDAAGGWWLRNASPAQSAVLVRGDERRHTGSIVPAAGQRLQAGAAVFEVVAADTGRVLLRDRRHAWSYDGALLLRDGEQQAACPDAGIAARLAAGWNRIAPAALAVRRPLAFGGILYCGNRLAVPGLDNGTLSLARDAAGVLALNVRGSQPVLLEQGGRWEDAARREHPLDGVDSLAVGRTRFALSSSLDALQLRPSGQVALFAEPKTDLPRGVDWHWNQRSLWQLAPPSIAACCAALAVFLLAAGAGLRCCAPLPVARAMTKLVLSCAIPACAVLLLVMQRSGAAPGAGWTLLLAWGALWHALLWPRRLQLVAAVAVLLFGAGLLVQLELGLGARDTAWLRYVENSCVLLAAGLPLGLLLCGGVARGALSRSSTEWLLVGLALAALAGLVLQVAFGDETGVFEVQPVEFAKLALSALSAHCLALATGGSSAPGNRRGWRDWLRMLAPALLFVLLLAVALVQVDDYSPLILLLVWAAVMFLAWCLATGRRLHAILAGGLCCALLAGAVGLQSAGPGLAGGFYAERFQVWADPGAHPHTGQQMLLGARAVAAGGWLGADGMFGLASLGAGADAGEALRIPAVQDDFAPSFFIHRHGLLGALLLWALQAALLASLLHAAAAAWRGAAGAGDFRRAWLGRFQCFVLAGGAAFLGGHFLLSWGTNLALFPIMGQPMSFLSSGGSHLLFFICPLLAFGMASVQSFEENPSCRSTSNTKSWPK